MSAKTTSQSVKSEKVYVVILHLLALTFLGTSAHNCHFNATNWFRANVTKYKSNIN